MIFQYGTESIKIDITERVNLACRKMFVIYIPACDDARAKLFGDPVWGIVKTIWIDGVAYGTIPIFIDTVSNQIYTDSFPDHVEQIYPDEVILARVQAIQKTLVLRHGSFRDELPEQKMAVRFLQPGDTVLELGGNVGRNSLIIASIVKSLVVLECDPAIAKQLEENRDANGMRFAIEPAALSLRPLIQKGWNTIVSEEVLPGYTRVNTITLDEIRAKYTYDTLVLDCEGAFYYILQDMPDVVYGVHTIIMENDYRDPTHKEYIDRILTEKGFSRIYQEALGAEYAWMKFPCNDSFFEVWRR